MSPKPSAQAVGIIAGIIVTGVAVDQITKAVAVARLVPGVPVGVVSDFFQLSLYRNSGAAFSSGANLTIAFSVLALAVLVAVPIWVVPRVRSRAWAVAVGLGLGGVAGNFVDRLFRDPGPFRGHVVDFLAVKYFSVFNVADMMLTAAAVMMVVLALILRVDFHGVRNDARSAGS